MPSVRELSDLYGNFMRTPRPGPSVCEFCFNLTAGYDRCYRCVHGGQALDCAVPISYSVAGEQLHHALWSYKRLDGAAARRLATELAAVVWRFLSDHERCVAERAGIESFALVTTVPSGDRERERDHPLPWIVGQAVGLTRKRYQRLLERSEKPAEPRAFAPEKYRPLRVLRGESVLLLDDTWTTGANAQSAAAALKSTGAGAVAAVVIGRHIHPNWHDNASRLRKLPAFQWSECALCAAVSSPVPAPS